MRLGIAMGSSIVVPYRKLGRGRYRSKSLPDERLAAHHRWASIDYLRILGKSQPRTGILVMRGLMMALFALDFPGHDGALKASHWAGRIGAPFPSSTTTAKTTITKKTAKTV